MQTTDIKLTKAFRVQTTKTILSIAFFAVSYLLIVLLAIGLTALCVYGGVMLIAISPSFLTIVSGAGLASSGILVLIFLLKFLFTSHHTDRSHFLEITRSDEPQLFAMIDEIVAEVQTGFPKKVYLSTDVNAAVFYDSGVWSMFFPVEKNLQIGLGLINTVSKLELKAILAHEFGHFSQRTMKVGSYVYNVNKVIFNMLYDNDSYDKLIQRWSSITNFFSFFVGLAVKIITGIQWVLKKLYVIVNKNYLGLSREMEFHADEIAANVTGFEPLKSSLLRMSLADYSFDSVLNFYNAKITDRIISDNLYRDQLYVLGLLAERSNFPVRNGLPDISLEEQSKFDKSKLVIKDQWASHPGMRERIERLEQTNIRFGSQEDYPANNIFTDIERLQKALTENIFRGVAYAGATQLISFEDFRSAYRNDIESNSFSTIYNGYYDQKNPLLSEPDNIPQDLNDRAFDELFSDTQVDLLYTGIALQSDIEILRNISDKRIDVKTFDYDGIKYSRKDSGALLQRLEADLAKVNEAIEKNDVEIFKFFKHLEYGQKDTSAKLALLYRELFEFDQLFDSRYQVYVKLSNDLQFINVTTPLEQISTNLLHLRPLEEALATEIRNILADPRYDAAITNEIRESLENYISKQWIYFNGHQYNDQNLNVLFSAMNNYAFLLSRVYFLLKKELLSYQESLLHNHTRQDASQRDFMAAVPDPE